MKCKCGCSADTDGRAWATPNCFMKTNIWAGRAGFGDKVPMADRNTSTSFIPGTKRRWCDNEGARRKSNV